jgi:uncharacterized protein YkwD
MFSIAALAVLAGCEVDPFSGLAVDAVNRERAVAGLPLLTREAGLDARAQAWAIRMRDAWVAGGCGVTKPHLRHSPDLVVQYRPEAVVGTWSKVGENVGVVGVDGGNGPAAIAALHRAYMASPSHKSNILGTYRYVGIGSVTGPTPAQKAEGACPSVAVDSVMWNTQAFVK